MGGAGGAYLYRHEHGPGFGGFFWVSADSKENSLEYMSPSDRAEFVFDSLPGSVFKAHVESIGWGVPQNSVDPQFRPAHDQECDRLGARPAAFPVRLIVEGTPPRGSVRFSSQVNVVVYTSNNPVTDALSAIFIHLISILTYAT